MSLWGLIFVHYVPVGTDICLWNPGFIVNCKLPPTLHFFTSTSRVL